MAKASSARKVATNRLEKAIDHTVRKNTSSSVVIKSVRKAVDKALDKKPVRKAMKKEAATADDDDM